MSNIIAVVWDFDKTLIGNYMQDPIFKKNTELTEILFGKK